MILCVSVLPVVISPFSFLILLIWFFSLSFLTSLANGLLILYILSRNQLLNLLIFVMVSFVFFFTYFCPNFYDFFPSINPGVLHFFFFLVALSVELSYLFDFSLVSWGKLVLLWTFPLALLLLNLLGFGLSCFNFR